MNGLDIINKIKKQKEDESTNEKQILGENLLSNFKLFLGIPIPKNQSKLIPRSYICQKLHIR